jgi:hypothetical protein
LHRGGAEDAEGRVGNKKSLRTPYCSGVFASWGNSSRTRIVRDAPFDERLSHHEGREEHEDRAGYGKIFSSFVLFVCSVVISIFVLVAA